MNDLRNLKFWTDLLGCLTVTKQHQTDLEVLAGSDGRHPAVANLGCHRRHHGEQHEGVLGVLLHRVQAPRSLVIGC